MHEVDALLDVSEARAAAPVGERVESDDVVGRVGLDPVTDEVRPDETGRAGHEELHGGQLTAGYSYVRTLARQAQLWMPRVVVFVAVLPLFPVVVVGGVLVLVVALDTLEGATVVVGGGTVIAWNDLPTTSSIVEPVSLLSGTSLASCT